MGTTNQDDMMDLAFQVGRLMKTKLRELGVDHGKLHDKVSSYQIHALFTLIGTATTMGELAEEMNITLPSATALVDRLVKSGLVERQTDPDDRRIIRLLVTQEGRKVCEAMKKHRKKAFKVLLDAMSERDQAALYRILTNVRQTLELEREKGL